MKNLKDINLIELKNEELKTVQGGCCHSCGGGFWGWGGITVIGGGNGIMVNGYPPMWKNPLMR